MKTSILIHPSELSRKWIDRMADGGVSTLGIHPEGGGSAIASLGSLLQRVKSCEFCGLADYALARGLRIEYEFHAWGYLVDRALFDTHPEYFRMNESGERTPSLNFCPSSAEAIGIAARGAAQLVGELYGSSDNYFFWSDDARGGICHCPLCRDLSPADQQLTVLNAMIREMKKVNPKARLAYLAYYDTLELPSKVTPEDGIFLEYAPIDKWHVREGRLTDEAIRGAEREIEVREDLIRYFGKDGSRVLEYWLDNSLFSKWKKPPVKFNGPCESVGDEIREYRELGYEDISTFGCFLGDDYEELYGEPDIGAFLEAIKNT